MKTLNAILAACAAAALVNTGCTTINTVEPAQPVAHREMVSDKRILTDASLSRSVRILGVNQATTPAGFLRIQVEVQNTTSSQKSFTYRVEWFDENAMIIPLPTYTAVPRTIEGKETLSLTATAPNPQAKDFRMKFLEPRN